VTGCSTFSSKDEPTDPADETINIFSVASGHLYERFLRIMMLSVIKHTKSPVKFWFLKNYLSPTFKVRCISILSAVFCLWVFAYTLQHERGTTALSNEHSAEVMIFIRSILPD
jgi:hypothetical protein